jgi:hypothetical protein
MFVHAVSCDHPDCGETAREATTEWLARQIALDDGWQRWRDPFGEVLDLCPSHHQPVTVAEPEPTR